MFSNTNHRKDLNISVLLADDHPGIISGIRHELSSELEILLKASVSNSTDLVKKLDEGGFDVLVSDYSMPTDRKSTRLNSSHLVISYAVFCLKKKNRTTH